MFSIHYSRHKHLHLQMSAALIVMSIEMFLPCITILYILVGASCEGDW